MRLTAYFYRLLRAREGVTAVEFAVIAPVLMLLLFGIIEFSLIMLVTNIMESATAISARLGKTNYADSGLTREKTITNSIANRAGSLVKPANLTITSKAYQEFDQISDPEPYTDTNGNGTRDAGEAYTDVNGNGQWDVDMGVAGFGGAGDIVVYTVTYPWPLVTPIISNLLGNGGVFTISTHAVVKNEPF